MCTLSVSNMIYHKFSHGAAFYTLNGKNVNVMLEFLIYLVSLLFIHGYREYFMVIFWGDRDFFNKISVAGF